MRRTHKITLLGAAAAALFLAFAPSAAAQVAVSGTFCGPHGSVTFGTGVPYGGYYGPYSSGYYGGDYGSGYCPPYTSYYAPAPVYVRPYRYYRPYYYGHGYYGHGYYGHGYYGHRSYRGYYGGHGHRY